MARAGLQRARRPDTSCSLGFQATDTQVEAGTLLSSRALERSLEGGVVGAGSRWLPSSPSRHWTG